MNEFLDLHYAEAAEPIRKYIQRIHDKAEASGKHHNCFGNLNDYGLDETDAQAGLDAFADAIDLAKSDAVRSRVERASICAYRAAIEPVWYKKRGPLKPELAEQMRPLVKRFFELCDNHQVDRPRETREDTNAAKKRLLALFGIEEGGDF
jgi:sugar phosphate isomerase/epimerase